MKKSLFAVAAAFLGIASLPCAYTEINIASPEDNISDLISKIASKYAQDSTDDKDPRKGLQRAAKNVLDGLDKEKLKANLQRTVSSRNVSELLGDLKGLGDDPNIRAVSQKLADAIPKKGETDDVSAKSSNFDDLFAGYDNIFGSGEELDDDEYYSEFSDFTPEL